jgi:uncharacterized protein (TIGR04222 family)
MTMLTTATTWAITSAQFATGYGALCVAAGVAIRWRWQQATDRTRRATGPAPELDLYEVAVLGGGPQRAITSALAQLHGDGVLRVRRREGTLKVCGALPPGADPVERAIFAAVRREPGISTTALRREVQEDDALTSLSARLTEAGLLLDERPVRRVRRLWIVGALLAALGVARVVAEVRDDEPIGWTAAAVLAVTLATWWLATRRPVATRSGRDLLGRLRGEHNQLHRHPLAGEGALAVALFGGGALWLADPAVASALDVPREDASGGGPGRSSRYGMCGAGGGSVCAGASSSCGSSGGCGGGGCGGG